jgi:hypothetical protein
MKRGLGDLMVYAWGDFITGRLWAFSALDLHAMRAKPLIRPEPCFNLWDKTEFSAYNLARLGSDIVIAHWYLGVDGLTRVDCPLNEKGITVIRAREGHPLAPDLAFVRAAWPNGPPYGVSRDVCPEVWTDVRRPKIIDPASVRMYARLRASSR